MVLAELDGSLGENFTRFICSRIRLIAYISQTTHNSHNRILYIVGKVIKFLLSSALDNNPLFLTVLELYSANVNFFSIYSEIYL